MARRFIVEADGGSRGNPGPSAYGAVVIDADTGEVLANLAEYLGVATNNYAEYSGAIAGLRHAATLDSTADVEVRLDSRLVVEQMSGRSGQCRVGCCGCRSFCSVDHGCDGRHR